MITLLRGEQRRSDESRRPGLRRFGGSSLERRGQQFAALTEVAAHEPESPKRGDEPKGRRRITLEQPLEGDAEIFTLGGEAPQSLGLAGAAQFTVGRLSECEVVAGVTVSQIVCGRAGGELLRGELTDRLEHPHPLAASAHQALVEQRGQHVEVGFAHRLDRLDRRTAREDREPCEQLPLGPVE